jgi:restriction system protein
MKFKMAKNSLFAVLLRSPWWISFVLLGGIVVASRALLPQAYAPFGMMSGLPFLVIGIVAAWRQTTAPDPARVAQELERVGAMGWAEFSDVLEKVFSKQGYSVERPAGLAADFRLTLKGAVTVVSCKRWKAANHGVDALRDLQKAQLAMGAQHSLYISLAPVSDKAQQYAKAQGIQLMPAAELALLMLKNA